VRRFGLLHFNLILHVILKVILPNASNICRVRQKTDIAYYEKKDDTTFYLRVFYYVSDRAVFSVATIKKKKIKDNQLLIRK